MVWKRMVIHIDVDQLRLTSQLTVNNTMMLVILNVIVLATLRFLVSAVRAKNIASCSLDHPLAGMGPVVRFLYPQLPHSQQL